MRGLNQLVSHLKTYGFMHKQLYAVALMLFFFAIFDGIFSFITPLYITQKGISEGMMGIIIGSSSIAGLLFDLLLCRILKDTRYRFVYLLMFIICFLYPLILWQANIIAIFIIAMALWGLYYDLLALANYDFIARTSKKEEYSTNFSVLRIFLDLGYFLAPLITGFIIIELIDFTPFIMAWIFLILAFICYFVVLLLAKNHSSDKLKKNQVKISSMFKELALWRKIGNFILPILIVTFMLNVIDAIYWTIGPLLSESLTFLGDLGGLFMMAYMLPVLIVGWFVGRVTTKYGKKKTAFVSLLVGSIFLTLFYFFNTPWILILLSFFSSFFTSFTYPAIAAAYADYISESPEIEKEITTMTDSFCNLGYIIGPIIAGFSGQYLGHINTFALLGLLGIIMTIILIRVTPKEINIKINLRKI